MRSQHVEKKYRQGLTSNTRIKVCIICWSSSTRNPRETEDTGIICKFSFINIRKWKPSHNFYHLPNNIDLKENAAFIEGAKISSKQQGIPFNVINSTSDNYNIPWLTNSWRTKGGSSFDSEYWSYARDNSCDFALPSTTSGLATTAREKMMDINVISDAKTVFDVSAITNQHACKWNPIFRLSKGCNQWNL